jgi:hypothetical protein
VLDTHVQGRGPDLVQPRRIEQLLEVTLTGAGKAGFIIDRGVEFSRSFPEPAERPASAGVIPDTCRDYATCSRYTCHLSQPGDRIVHEVHNELGDGRVEGSVRKRQMFRRCLFDLNAGQPFSSREDELIGRVDGRNAGRAEPADKLGRERPGPAADVEDALRPGYTGK